MITLSYLQGGNTAVWRDRKTQELADWETAITNGQNPPPIFQNFPDFINQFKACFCDPNPQGTVQRELARVSMGKEPPNSVSTTSDSIKHRVDTMMSGSSSFSTMDSHHGSKPESASSTPHSLHSSNGKKKQSSLTDRRGWTKQLNKTFRIDKDTDNPLIQTN